MKKIILFFVFLLLATTSEARGEGTSNAKFGIIKNVLGSALSGPVGMDLKFAKRNAEIFSGSELTTLNGVMTFDDRYGGRWVLGPQSNLRVTDNGKLVLNKGSVWVQDGQVALKVASGIEVYSAGTESIVTFSTGSGSYQALSVQGSLKINHQSGEYELFPGTFVSGSNYNPAAIKPQEITIKSLKSLLTHFSADKFEVERVTSYVSILKASKSGQRISGFKTVKPLDGSVGRSPAGVSTKSKKIQLNDPMDLKSELMSLQKGINHLEQPKKAVPHDLAVFQQEFEKIKKKKKTSWKAKLPKARSAKISIVAIEGVNEKQIPKNVAPARNVASVEPDSHMKMDYQVVTPKDGMKQLVKKNMDEIDPSPVGVISSNKANRKPANVAAFKQKLQKIKSKNVTLKSSVQPPTHVEKRDQGEYRVRADRPNVPETVAVQHEKNVNERSLAKQKQKVIRVDMPANDRLSGKVYDSEAHANTVKNYSINQVNDRSPAAIRGKSVGKEKLNNSAKGRLMRKLRTFKTYYDDGASDRRPKIIKRGPAAVGYSGDNATVDLSENY